MRVGVAGVLVLACLISQTGFAAPVEYRGKGFDCRFHTEFEQLTPFTVWYGQINKAPVMSPQIQDTAKLFSLAGLNAGMTMTVYAKDEWPKRFTLNYFEERGRGNPSSIFTVFENSNNDGSSFLAEIAQFSLEQHVTDPNKAIILKRYRGVCKVKSDITFAEFRSGLSK